MAAGDAVEAALLAERGLVGPPASIEGRRGMLALMGDHVDLELAASKLREGLGDRWVSERLAPEPVGEDGDAVLRQLLAESPETPWRSVLASLDR
jgi:2-methylcitrate dehydratase PrpD